MANWECPQLRFLQWQRVTFCLRCDCKPPAVASIGKTNLGFRFGYQKNVNNLNRQSRQLIACWQLMEMRLGEVDTFCRSIEHRNVVVYN